jgi:aspartyl-tRNA(Asn)/glutamyl-tRNA(Gln) amidotransferase subunit A
MSPIGIGSDVAISVRGPAAFTGISALKASHGRIPYTGHFPRVTQGWWHVGPMARTVRDVARFNESTILRLGALLERKGGLR